MLIFHSRGSDERRNVVTEERAKNILLGEESHFWKPKKLKKHEFMAFHYFQMPEVLLIRNIDLVLVLVSLVASIGVR